MTSPVTDFATGFVSSTAVKQPVECATTANITLEGLQTIDGISVTAGMRVLVKNQTAGAENGIYIASTGAWSRAADLNDNNDVQKGTRVFVASGSVNGGNEFYISTDNRVVIDTSTITWTQYPRPLSFNITRAQIPSTVIPFTSIAVSGYATVGDLGSGAVYVRGTSSGPMAIQDAAGTWWELLVGDELSIAHVGATEGPDCGPYINIAIELMRARGGGVVRIPKGTWVKKKSSIGLRLRSNVALEGYGWQSVIYHEDLAATARSDLTYFEAESNLRIANLKIVGGLETDLTETNNSVAIVGNTSDNIVIENVYFKNLRYFATGLRQCRNVTVKGCLLEDILRDGIHITSSTDVKVIDNSFVRVVDDAVGAHTLDDSGVAENSIIVSRNYFESCQSVKILGGKAVTITDNTFALTIRAAIVVDTNVSGVEGNTSTISIKIKGNTILDTMGDRGIGAVIYVATPTRSKAALTLQPGINAPVFDYNWLTNTDASGGIYTGNFALDISDNVIGWTRKRDVDYSSYGLGEFLDRTPSAAYYDPTMTDAVYGAAAIAVDGHIGYGRISNNLFFGGHKDYKVIDLFGSSSADLFSVYGLEVSRNRFFDWPSVKAISIGSNTTASRQVSIIENDFNLDPFVRHPDHAADGTWTSATSCMAASVSSVGVGGEFRGNRFRNMAKVTDITPSQMVFGQNYIYFRPSGGTNPFDDNSVNKGVRNFASDAGYLCVVEYSDPSDGANYGKLYGNSAPVTVASAMPSSGFYVAKHWVHNSSRSASNGRVLLGWDRISTGTGHVENTDWLPIYGGNLVEQVPTITTFTSNTLACTIYNSLALNPAAPQTITDITTTLSGSVEIVVRNASANAVTFTHNTSKIRCNGGADVVLNQYQSARFCNFGTAVWQQV